MTEAARQAQFERFLGSPHEVQQEVLWRVIGALEYRESLQDRGAGKALDLIAASFEKALGGATGIERALAK